MLIATKSLQFLDDRLPEVVYFSRVERCHSRDNSHTIRFHLFPFIIFHLSFLLFHLSFFIFHLLFHLFPLSLVVELHFRGRQTALVVTSPILQEPLDMIALTRNLIALHEGHCVLEITHVHIEHLVVVTDLLTLRLQLALLLGTLTHLSGQRGCYRSSVGQSGGIHMPSR